VTCVAEIGAIGDAEITTIEGLGTVVSRGDDCLRLFQEPSVDDELGACNVHGFVGGEEQRRVRDIPGIAPAEGRENAERATS
jgi:hypothetical protein